MLNSKHLIRQEAHHQHLTLIIQHPTKHSINT